MAKKGPESEGEEYEFTPPDFDEDAFIHKELTGFKTTVILVLWGIVAALVAWLVYATMGGQDRGWAVGLTVAILAGFALKWIFSIVGADVSHYGRKEWLGTALLFFFTFLSVFIIVVNPPVSDHAPPHVEVYVSPPVQHHMGDVTLDVFAIDNAAVEGLELEVRRGDQTVAGKDAFRDMGEGRYQIALDGLTGGSYMVHVRADDRTGHTTERTVPFNVSRSVVDYERPGDGALADTDDHVRFALAGDLEPCVWDRVQGVFTNAPCIRRAYLELDTGSEVPLTFDAENDQWAANKNHPGWTVGTRTFTFHAETGDRFHGQARVEGGDIRASNDLDGAFSIDVTTDALGGKEIPPPLPDPERPPMRQVPGIGSIVLVAGLLGLAAVVRRRS